MDDELPAAEYVDCFAFTGEEVIERAPCEPSTGKSALIFNLFLQDIEHGHDCLVLDPHADLIADILQRLTEW